MSLRIAPAYGVACAIVGLLLAAPPARAHHSTAAYDLIHGTLIHGVVTGFLLINPHSQIRMDIAGEDDVTEHWAIELDSAGLLRRLGWSKQTLKPGDHITVMGGRAKNGSFHLRAVWVELPDGRRLPALPQPEK